MWLIVTGTVNQIWFVYTHFFLFPTCFQQFSQIINICSTLNFCAFLMNRPYLYQSELLRFLWEWKGVLGYELLQQDQTIIIFSFRSFFLQISQAINFFFNL